MKDPYVYFMGLQNSNVPNGINNNYDIISWYLQSSVRHHDINHICHDVSTAGEITLKDIKIKYHPSSFRLDNFKGLITFVLWAFTSILISILDLLRGNWWHAFMLGEAAMAKVVSINSSNSFASSYLFYYLTQSYRPMWTYEAEKKGIEIVCYFYSTFCDLKLPDKNVYQNHVFHLYNWPKTWVWDSQQLENIKRCSSFPVDGEVVGPIWFNDINENIQFEEIPCVSVFDLQPQRKYFSLGYSCIIEYFENFPNLRKQFLYDIFSCCQLLEIKMIHKVKRDIGFRSNKGYTGIIRKLQESSSYRSVNPEISAIKVINVCEAVISAPFSSTVLYGRMQSKPSIYYDPTGWIQKDDPAAHGVPILSGKQELYEWLTLIFIKQRPLSPAISTKSSATD